MALRCQQRRVLPLFPGAFSKTLGWAGCDAVKMALPVLGAACLSHFVRRLRRGRGLLLLGNSEGAAEARLVREPQGGAGSSFEPCLRRTGRVQRQLGKVSLSRYIPWNTKGLKRSLRWPINP